MKFSLRVGKKALVVKCQKCGNKKLCRLQHVPPHRWIWSCGKCRKSNRRNWPIRSS